MNRTERNLAVQGYRLSSADVRQLRGLVTVTNFCVPSTLLGFWWRWRGTPTQSEMSPAT